MTMAHLGPERPGAPSETRKLTEQSLRRMHAHVSGRTFWILLALIILALAAAMLLLR